MKSKILTGIMAVILVFAISSNLSKVYGYSDSDYSIDVPSTYTRGSDGSFTKNDNSVMIMISKEYVGEIEDFGYNDENLKLLMDNFETGLSLSGATVEQHISSMIMTFTKNNYKCFSFALKLDVSGTTMYTDTYMLISGKNLYSLTAMAQNISDAGSSEVKNIINSFTIKDFENMDTSSSNPVTATTNNNKNTEKEEDDKDEEIKDDDKDEDKDEDKAQKDEKTTKNEKNEGKEKSKKDEEDDDDEKENFLDTTMGHVVLYGGAGFLICLIAVLIVVKIASKNSKTNNKDKE